MPNLKDEPSLQQLYSSVHNQLYASQKDLYTWLQVLEEICPLSARMVVNQVSMKMENERITALIQKLKEVLAEEEARKKQEG